MSWSILAVNPGSTSTKIALFHSFRCVAQSVVRHDTELLSGFSTLPEQLSYRTNLIRSFLLSHGFEAEQFDAVIGRGGLIGPVSGGVYRVNSAMKKVLEAGAFGVHASNLGALIASELAGERNCTALIADPPSVDEMIDLARVTGLKEIRRNSIFHALNQKAVARLAAKRLGRQYDQINLIVCHAGGGISVGAHLRGRVVDVNNALEEGPFSPDRAGSLPSISLLNLSSRLNLRENEFYRLINGQGGLISLTGSSDALMLENKRLEVPEYDFYLKAMAYQISKQIAAMSAVLSGDIQAVVFTGGLAHSLYLQELIEIRTRHIAPFMVFPGEHELEALAAAAVRALSGQSEIREYIIPQQASV